MTKPVIAGLKSIEVELEEGRDYFFCTCGRSESQPFCDGSHKGTEFKSHKFTAEKTGKAWLCACKHTKDTPFCDGSHKPLRQQQEQQG